ncbi:hypothetical protein M426DRAFT_318014 [Hypoxylon sp. CI-4A]|nr:hypothetical protein M426DRAFT_318014 [Hypoxylon sp. CI-4A]
MGDFKARIKARLLRRHSAFSSLGSSKRSLSRDRTSSSTHTQASTGYAASLSTAASDGKQSNEKGPITKEVPCRDSIISSGDSSPRNDGASGSGGVHFIIPSRGHAELEAGGQEGEEQEQEQEPEPEPEQGSEAETVPPELEKLEKLNQVSNSTNNSNPSKIISDLSPSVDGNNLITAPKSTAKSTAKTGKDLQNFAINSAHVPIPAVTTPTSISTSTSDPETNPNSNIVNTPNPVTAATPLPSIDEYRPAASAKLQLKPPVLDLPRRDDYDDIPRPTSAGRALSPSSTVSRPAAPPRRQSILPVRQTHLIKALLNTGYASEIASPEPDSFLPISGNMVTRKVWVKRPLASPTLITINEDDLVDDVRDMILRKYANSLGRQFDAPDLTLRICDRDQQTTRTLQPDEPMGRTLDAYYPGGQSVDDALLIDIPGRRTPKASPNPRYFSEDRPHESGTDYFPPYPPASQHPSANSSAAANGAHQLHFPPSLTVLGGGQLPPLPSPGGTRRLGSARPKIQRMHTASPVATIGNGHASQVAAPPTGMHNYPRQPRSRTHSGASSEQSNHPPAAPSISTPPVPERTATPPPRVSSPRLVNRPKKAKKVDHPSLPPGMLNGGVPPINVLIVEDNIINLKLLEAFVKRLKVRWQTAMNGREAVNKWRAGGFHLVLMDIQLPVMSGLDATREIRRLEKVNSIGVFSSSASSPPDEIKAEPADEDKLVNTEMFKSPVIIVALTASSLQSDRHEALAAGCNDFLTKPVNFVWLERKVMEWGCMQALIDFDGWRKWKDFSQKAQEDDSKKAAAAKGAKIPKKNRFSMTAAA